MSEQDEQQPMVCEKHGIALTKSVTGWGCNACAAEYLNEINKAGSEQNSRKIADDELSARRENKRKRLDMVGIPPRFRNRKLADYQARTLEQKKALQMVSAYGKRLLAGQVCGGLILFGKVGTGKTHMACSIASAYEAQDKLVLFTSVADMISKIRESYDANDMTELQAIMEFRDFDLLVLDEVGVQKGDKKEIDLLTRVIDARYGWEKPTILLSNLGLDEMVELLGQRIIDRLSEDGGMLVEFGWESFRGKAAQVYRG